MLTAHRKIKLQIFLLLAACHLLLAPLAYAQDSSNISVAQYLPVAGDKIEDGDIVSASGKGYALSQVPYDPGMVGVVTENAAIILGGEDQQGYYPVSNSGVVSIKVSNENGEIKKGDLITASTKPGVGMKATNSGFVLGQAQEDFSGKETGKIQTSVNLRYAISANSNARVFKGLKDVFSLSAIAALEKPTDVIKYVIAAALVLVSIFLAVLTFGRSAALGVEALGRNPRAGHKITLGIVINVLISLGIVGAGVVGTYFILLS